MADTNAASAADTSASDAATKTSAAQTGAAVGATQTAAQTGAGQTDVGAAQRAGTVQAESVTDVGQGEAYLVNMKRLVAGELSQDADLRAIQTAYLTRTLRNAEDFDQNLRATFLQITNNMVALANSQNTNSHDINNRSKVNAANHDQRVQVIAEEGISENPIFQDAITASVVKALERAGLVKPTA